MYFVLYNIFYNLFEQVRDFWLLALTFNLTLNSRLSIQPFAPFPYFLSSVDRFSLSVTSSISYLCTLHTACTCLGYYRYSPTEKRHFREECCFKWDDSNSNSNSKSSSKNSKTLSKKEQKKRRWRRKKRIVRKSERKKNG